ncbi:MAG: hypothetical protein ACI8TX_002258 [Hyphomicrobiaceae bacterium]|jgi:hypothetical protein
MTMTVGRDITAQVCPPRAAYIHFPMGNTAGPAGRPDLQRAIVGSALESAVAMTVPGTIVDLPFATATSAPDGKAWEEWVYTKEFRRHMMKTREGHTPAD